MSYPKQQAGIVVTEYLGKHPTVPSLTLARKIYQDHSLLFSNVDAVRALIRFYRNASGNKKAVDQRFYGQKGQMLTEGEEPEYTPYELPKVNNKVLFMSDIHLPFHDLASIRIALEDARDKKVNTVILGGDILDMYNCSSFDKTPSKSSFIHERELFYALIDDIDYYLPHAKVFWIEGNHEYRFKRYMLNKALEIFDVPEFTMESLFSVRELGIEYIGRKQFIKAGNLNIMHGHEYGNVSAGVNPARGMFLKAKDSVIFGHLHKSSEHVSADLRGTITSVYSVGCLCYLHPEYRPLNEWNTGYGLIELHPDGGFMVKNKKIVGGKIQ
jgi:predicted phosphodiesterase